MARRQTKHGRAQNGKKANVVIWGIIVVILVAAAVLFTANFHEDTKNKLKNAAYPQSYSEYVNEAARKYDLSPALIYAVIRTESNFDRNAHSSASAYGLMQITGDTFDYYMMLRGEEGKYTHDDLFDPAVNIDYGCAVLKSHLDTFGDEKAAVAAYNAGPGHVAEWLDNPNISLDGKTLITENIPFEETRNYVQRVEDAKNTYIELYY